MIVKSDEVKLNLLPLLNTVEHLYYYEGPCRFGQGETLIPGYDRLANAEKAEGFLSDLKDCLPRGIHLMEPVRLNRTDDWDNKDVQWDAISASVQNCDAVVVMSGIACDDRILEFAVRFNKPVLMAPSGGFSATSVAAALNGKYRDYECYSFYRWEDLNYRLSILRARKVIRNTKILCASRFGAPTSYSSVDAFNNFTEITDRLGVQFRFVNLHELFDNMSPATEDGNHTTPGRRTLNLTDADMKLVNDICDDLCGGAVENTMEREKMLPSIIAYVTVLKAMDDKDCCGFTIPCPDACSTRRLNELQFTPCVIHSLNMESGIPSACEYDTNAVLAQQALMAVSFQRPYMGNTCPIPLERGHLVGRFGSTPEQLAALEENPDNLYMMQHSVAHRCLNDPEEKAPYAIRHFAHDQKFGVTIRYNFDVDAGKKITLCRFSSDGRQMFIGSGKIVMGGGYNGYNCSQMVYFRVKNQKDTWEKQCKAGNHVAMVYGDYVQQLKDLACSMDVEPLVAD